MLDINNVVKLQEKVKKANTKTKITESSIVSLILQKCLDVINGDNSIKHLCKLANLPLFCKKKDIKSYNIEVGDISSIFYLIGDMLLRQDNENSIECELQDIALIALQTIELQGFNAIELAEKDLII